MFSFIETRLFTRLVQEYLDDDEYAELQKVLMENPETGDGSQARVACVNFAGAHPDEGNVVGIV